MDVAPLVAALRLRLGLRNAYGAPGAAVAIREELEPLVANQMAWWEPKAPLRRGASADTLRTLNRDTWSIFVFSASAGRVVLWPKPRLAVGAQDQRLYDYSRRIFGIRAAQCRAYLEHVLRRARIGAAFDLVLDAADAPRDSPAFPIFSLNKDARAHNVLLPDTDFFDYDWYRSASDRISYDDKALSACFVGSSTGGDRITLDKVGNGTVPRLRAAACFQGHADVMFRISGAVSCESPAVERHMGEQPWFGGYVSWREQLRHRFLISMDGHGAAWSRFVRSLRSNSVLLKYDSPMVTYFYPALKPGRDYLPIREDADIPRIVAQERERPGRFRPVAEAGGAFARKFLTPTSVSAYTAMLLERYAAAY